MKKIKGAVVKAANIDIQYLGGGSLFIQVQHGLHIEESERQGERASERFGSKMFLRKVHVM